VLAGVFLTSILIFLRVPSLISPPDPAPSPSLPDPAPPGRGRLPSVSLLTIVRIAGFLLVCEEDPPSCAPAGERDRGVFPLGVLAPVPKRECAFFCFLRDDSFPLRSEALADPLRLSELRSGCLLLRFDGVLFFDESPCDPFAACSACSASFFCCSSRSRSSSESVESVY
jgi:hypothetical protein